MGEIGNVEKFQPQNPKGEPLGKLVCKWENIIKVY
jgi:hypothetical protein